MTDTNIRRVILDLAVEDSYAPSEIVARVHRVYTHQPASEVRELVRKAVGEMLDLGLLGATWLESPGDPEAVLEANAARAALGDDLAWLAHNHWRPHPRITATSLGRDKYNSHDDI
jgi:hypothetical protein